MRHLPIIFLLFLLSVALVSGQSVLVSQSQGASRDAALVLGAPGDTKVNIPSLPAQWKDYLPPWRLEDQNADGVYDYALRRDKKQRNEAEAYDFNYDGMFDDYYIYEEGVLIRREVDSNFDGKIDLWVYLKNGSYIRAYEKDNDFDGILDKVKQY